MLRPAALVISALIAACTPPPAEPLDPPIPPPRPDVVETRAVSLAPPADDSPLRAPRFLEESLSGIRIEAVTFDSRTHRLAVADQPSGPGSIWPDSRAAGRALNGIAAVNGGFFTPGGDPLGKVVSREKPAGAVNRASSLGSGFFIDDGRPALIRRDRFQGAREALQTGPFLVENRRPVDGLGTQQSSARTFIATDGRNGWIIARTGPCSLSQLAAALAGETLGGVRIHTALNLDGGRSSEIWTASSVIGGPSFTRPLWNSRVRNFLVLRPVSSADP